MVCTSDLPDANVVFRKKNGVWNVSASTSSVPTAHAMPSLATFAHCASASYGAFNTGVPINPNNF